MPGSPGTKESFYELPDTRFAAIVVDKPCCLYPVVQVEFQEQEL